MQNEKRELRSLNEELPTLYVEELEQRLETDPLAVSGLWDTNSLDTLGCNGDVDVCKPDFSDCNFSCNLKL